MCPVTHLEPEAALLRVWAGRGPLVPCAARAGHPLDLLLPGQLLVPLLLPTSTLLRLLLCDLTVLWDGSLSLRLRAVVPAGIQQCIASDSTYSALRWTKRHSPCMAKGRAGAAAAGEAGAVGGGTCRRRAVHCI